MEVLNEVGRPAMSMAVVHPLDLAEDEMRVEGTQLAAELATAKMVNSIPSISLALFCTCLSVFTWPIK